MPKMHFCTVPTVAVCGYDLNCGVRFHKETTSCFADVTCVDCRDWLYKNYLAPAGYTKPEAWVSTG